MPQHYFYNGQQIDTFDGVSGTIVSTIPHDSSPDVMLSEQDNAGANGASLVDFRFRKKPLTLTGAIKGTSQADFEQKVDAFKHLFSQPKGELKITNYGTLEYRLATFEEGEVWSGSPTFDFTNYKLGKRSMALEGTSLAEGTSSWGVACDLSSFTADDDVRLWAHVADASKVAAITVRFETTAGTDYYVATWASGIVTGDNELSIARSNLTAIGAPSWATITNIRVGVTGTGLDAATVSFDDLRLVTESESRIYDVTLSAPIALPRSYSNVIWCKFSVQLSCTEGVARSDKRVLMTFPDTTKTLLRIPRHLSGSGPQFLSLALESFGTHPLSIYDHFADDFSTYADATEAGNVYALDGTWSITDREGYRTCLQETAGVGVVSASIRNTPLRDGEIIALVATGGRAGIFARATEGDPASGITAVHTGLTASLTDPFYGPLDKRNTEDPTFGAFNWVWIRLRCEGNVVEFSYRGLNYDTWTRIFRRTTTTNDAGAWGIFGDTGDITCAFVELRDLSAGKTNALTVTPANGNNYRVSVDTKKLVVNGDGGDMPVSGSFPTMAAGANDLSILFPHSTIGAQSFYELSRLMDSEQVIGGALAIKQALIFDSDENTHIRRRGSFTYLLRSNGAAYRGDVKVSIQALTAGYPNGTILDDVNSDPAFVIISEEDIKSYFSTLNPAYNASMVPMELVWNADIPVTPNTDYGLVFESTDPGATIAHYIPTNTSALGALSCKEYDGSWGATSRGGYAILAGDNPNTATNPWTASVAYTPTYL